MQLAALWSKRIPGMIPECYLWMIIAIKWILKDKPLYGLHTQSSSHGTYRDTIIMQHVSLFFNNNNKYFCLFFYIMFDRGTLTAY